MLHFRSSIRQFHFATKKRIFSPRKCRELLGDESAHLSDDQITQLRDQLLSLANVAVSTYTSRPSTTFDQAVGTIAPDDRSDVEERAAILEFDGNLSRDQAERLAVAQRISPQLLRH